MNRLKTISAGFIKSPKAEKGIGHFIVTYWMKAFVVAATEPSG